MTPQTRQIPLTQGYVAIVDEEDFETLTRHSWQVVIVERSHTQYAVRSKWDAGRKSSYGMHRQILGLEHGDPRCVDHINGNGLDNRRSNLRLCTHQQNQQNRSAKKGRDFKGVHKRKERSGFHAYIGVNGHQEYLGTYPDAISAAKAYDAAAQEYFGEFARLNFP